MAEQPSTDTVADGPARGAAAAPLAAALGARYAWKTYVCGHAEHQGLPPLAVLWDSGRDGGGAFLFVSCGHGNDLHPPEALSVKAWGWCCERWPELLEVDAHLTPDTWQTRQNLGQPWVIEPNDEE